jgi:hypothetical protein
MATYMWTYRLGMQKKNQESSCSFNALLIVVTFVLVTQHKHGDGNSKTNRQTTNRMKQGERKEEVGKLQPSWLLPTFTFCLCSCNNMKTMVMARQTDKQAKTKTQKQGEGKRSRKDSHPPNCCQTPCVLLPMNEHTQSNVVLEPSLLVPMLQLEEL